MKLFFGTGNGHKFDEFRETLNSELELKQVDKDILEPQLDSVEEVSKYKLERLLEKTDLEDEWVFVEDSGLFINELNGFPGAFTSAFSSNVEREKILRLIDKDYSAVFRTAIALKDPEGEIHTLIGECEGKLVEARGEDGWGFDPYFEPKGHDKTFSEDMEYKEKVSHRKTAANKLNNFLKDKIK